ncbi:MAG: hypothetical protein GXY25_20715 [Pirellulaceae bacterium]|nr:hypothetical protein [Pirellulaceae bacterium]
MELPRRDPGDELLRPGELADIRLRLRNLAAKHDLATVIVHAFDDRTRMLPFIHTDRRMAPGGVRAIGAAMVDAGFYKTRIVLQQWNKNFRPSQMRLDGRIPDLFMVSSMQLHSAPCDALIRDACRIDLADRPLIIAGGPRVIYQPWEVFASDSTCPWGADVAVTGEEYVLLSLLEVLLSIRANGESIRSAFIRARDCGDLDAIPGLVYARNGATGVTEELIDTGVQRLLGDLDELPHPALGYRLLEPPSDGTALGPHALPPGQVRKHCRIASLIMTLGCKFGCPYCPIPAYNQRQYRVKSGERISDEMERIYNDYGISFFFGADDNFFNDRQRTLDITETLARNVAAGSRPHCKIRWGTEATIHDTLAIKEHLPVVRKAGLWALWLGVEDMTGALVKKGQSTDKTVGGIPSLAAKRHIPYPHVDAPRFAAAIHVEQRGWPAQSGETTAKGRSRARANHDADPRARFEIVRGGLLFRPCVPTRQRHSGRTADRRRKSCRRLAPSTSLDQTDESPGGVFLFLQPVEAAGGDGLPQDQDPLGGCGNLAARGRKATPCSLEELPPVGSPKTASTLCRCRCAAIRNVGPGPYRLPYAGLVLAPPAGQYPTPHQGARQPDSYAKRRWRSSKPRASGNHNCQAEAASVKTESDDQDCLIRLTRSAGHSAGQRICRQLAGDASHEVSCLACPP